MIRQETVDRALREIRKGFAQYQYFFDQLDSPAWLEPLSRAGFFRTPPPPVREGETIRLPLWPESRYLVRMSGRPEAQPTVLQIALEIPSTENSRVHDDLADVALALRPAQSAMLVPQACRWPQSPFKLLMPEKIGDLIVHLVEGGEGQAGLMLARSALALSPDPRSSETGVEDLFLRLEPRAHFDHFYYERMLRKAVPALLRISGLDAVRLCLDLLNDAIEFSMKPDQKAGGEEDYLYIRHPAIEQGSSRDDIPDTLLCVARDSAEQLIAKDRTQFGAVLELLKSKRWISFRRLELHLCRLFPDEGRALTEQFFQTPERLEQSNLRHEAILLIKTSFHALTNETQQKVLNRMNQGPPDDRIRAWLELVQKPVTAENIKTISDEWRRDQLAILQGQLPEPYQQRLAELVAAAGAARSLEESPRSKGGAFGPQSPKSIAELGQMAVEDVVSFLATWTAGTSELQPSEEGMGRDLTSIVGRKPVDYAAAASRFRNLDPTYVRSFFIGLTSALKNGLVFDWFPVLELAAWVASQPREIPGRKGALFVRDPDWGWTRDSIIDLVAAGFEERPGKLTFDHRPVVWQTLKPLVEDPFPSPEDEAGPNFDPAFLSINSTRGRAFFAVVQYALWVQGCASPQLEDWKLHTFDVMPEVREALDAHLDPSLEPTLTIRSVYGRCLESLARLDWGWLRNRLPLIFPTGEQQVLQFRAAWDSFLATWTPNGVLLPLLAPAYKKAIEQIGKAQGKMQGPSGSDHLLAEHLMVFYWWGKLRFGAEDHLLDNFYAAAPDRLLGHAMWFVGRSVSGWDAKNPHEAIARLQELIESRLETARFATSADDCRQELSGFGWWFTTGKFDEQWELATLLSVLQLTKKVANDMDVVKRLAELCPKYPEDCVACLRLMIEGDQDRMLLVGVERETEELLTHALSSPAAAASARRVTEELIARGHFRYRRLLDKDRNS